MKTKKYSLIVDRGNTATKAALYESGALVDISVDSVPQVAVSDVVARHQADITAAIYSTVGAGGEQAMRFIRDYAPHVLSVADDIDLVIKVQPKHRPTLGADRIAAAAGAYAMMPGKWVLVVDSGTAVTYDVVTPDGLFLGGNIAPGLKTGLDALHRMTALLPQVQVPDAIDDVLLGDDTESAMLKGVVYGVVGAIESMSARLGDETHVVLTGGGAPLIAPLLRIPVTMSPHLVLDGLSLILRRNLAL